MTEIRFSKLQICLRILKFRKEKALIKEFVSNLAYEFISHIKTVSNEYTRVSRKGHS
jgi:hypothetical protein